MTPAVRVRCANIGDAPAILALEAQFPTDRLSARSIQRFLNGPRCRVWVGLVRSRVQAALILLYRRNSSVARVYSLVVHPDARGLGLAKRLVRCAQSTARQAGKSRVSLEVREDNLAARTLYADLGYREEQFLADYYEDGASGLRLTRMLAGPRR